MKSLPRVVSPKDRERVEGCLPGCKFPFISWLLLCKADLRQPRSSQIKDAGPVPGTVHYGCAEIRWAEETWDKQHKHLLHVDTGEPSEAWEPCLYYLMARKFGRDSVWVSSASQDPSTVPAQSCTPNSGYLLMEGWKERWMVGWTYGWWINFLLCKNNFCLQMRGVNGGHGRLDADGVWYTKVLKMGQRWARLVLRKN